jgi:phage shock protein E
MKTLSIIAFLLAVSVSVPGAEPSGNGGLITPEKAKKLIGSDKTVVLLDVRTAEEFESGHIEGSVLLPYDLISPSSAGAVIPSSETTVLVYCRSGRRSAIAADSLRKLGYMRVFDLGGINTWPYGLVQ